uniref:Putative secreted protein n=1 Tax=Anopheles darlingi TaxID=43151 RepID=A0A2M4D6K5_ANODA
MLMLLTSCFVRSCWCVRALDGVRLVAEYRRRHRCRLRPSTTRSCESAYKAKHTFLLWSSTDRNGMESGNESEISCMHTMLYEAEKRCAGSRDQERQRERERSIKWRTHTIIMQRCRWGSAMSGFPSRYSFPLI